MTSLSSSDRAVTPEVRRGVISWVVKDFLGLFFCDALLIQTERGHTVASGGPYRVVRHPGYFGAILYQLSTSFLLGSWWALLPMAAIVPLYVLRTALEDRALHEELDGYREYAEGVSHRLVPGILKAGTGGWMMKANSTDAGFLQDPDLRAGIRRRSYKCLSWPRSRRLYSFPRRAGLIGGRRGPISACT